MKESDDDSALLSDLVNDFRVFNFLIVIVNS